MKKYTVILLLLSIGVLNSTCKKVPKETQKGKNVLGCKVDGVVFRSDWFKHKGGQISGGWIGISSHAKYSSTSLTKTDTALYIWAIDGPLKEKWQANMTNGANPTPMQNKNSNILIIYIKESIRVQEYMLNCINCWQYKGSGYQYGYFKVNFAYYFNAKKNKQYFANSGRLNITHLTDKIVSGTFEFSAQAEDGETINITHGVLDLKLT